MTRQQFSDGVHIGYHQLFVSFQYLSSDDVSSTTTQSDSIANGNHAEPEEGALTVVEQQQVRQGRRDSLGEAVVT